MRKRITSQRQVLETNRREQEIEIEKSGYDIDDTKWRIVVFACFFVVISSVVLLCLQLGCITLI